MKQISDFSAKIDPETVTMADVESNIVRCPDQDMAVIMEDKIKEARKEGDSLGGIIECVARNVPAGLGEPVFGKLDAELAHAILSIPACKGFEVGSGFEGISMTGSSHNDPFYNELPYLPDDGNVAVITTAHGFNIDITGWNHESNADLQGSY